MRAKAAWLAVAAFLAVPFCLCATALEDGFANPPASTKPQTWYHIMNGNATKLLPSCLLGPIALRIARSSGNEFEQQKERKTVL